MPEENVELVRRAFGDWNRGMREIREEEVDSEMELHSRMLGRVLRGVDGLRAWFREIDEQFDRWQLEIEEIREVDPDRLVVLGSIHLRGRESGVQFEQPMGWLIDFRDGRFRRMRMFPDRGEALEAAGLSDQTT
jgi:ketosteroid isomerase-like protein